MQSNDGDGHAATQNVGSPPSPLSSTQGPTDTGPRWALHAFCTAPPPPRGLSRSRAVGNGGGVTRFSKPTFCPDGRNFFFPTTAIAMAKAAAIAALGGLIALGAYSVDAGSVSLTKSNFDTEVLNSGKSAFVKFQAPW